MNGNIEIKPENKIMKRKVTIKEKGDTWFVFYCARNKHQRYAVAQFHKSMRDLQGVKDWVLKNPKLELVEGDPYANQSAVWVKV